MPQKLIALLEVLLKDEGFWHFPHMSYFVRARKEVRDIVGWVKKGDTYGVYFGVWVPEFEEGLNHHDVDESADIKNLNLMHDLSLQSGDGIAPWWDEGGSSNLDRQQELLRARVQSVVLPYFKTFASFGDVVEMVLLDARFSGSALENRLLSNAMAAFFNYDLEQATEGVNAYLKPLQNVSPIFQFSGGYYWRKNEQDVFHIIYPQFYAAWRFVKFYVAVWHPVLDGIESHVDHLPSQFTRLTARSFTSEGGAVEDALPTFIGESYLLESPLLEPFEGLRSYGLPWLQSIQDLQGVIAALRPEHRKFYTF